MNLGLPPESSPLFAELERLLLAALAPDILAEVDGAAVVAACERMCREAVS